MMIGGEEKISILKCKIRGIRTEQRVRGKAYGEESKQEKIKTEDPGQGKRQRRGRAKNK